MNSISSNLHSSYHLYADSLLIYTHVLVSMLLKAPTVINSNLELISTWSNDYGLKMNSLIISARIEWSIFPPVLFNNTISG